MIQNLCNRIFDYCAEHNEKTVTIGIVRAAADEMVKDSEHFHTLWDYIETERRKLVLCLIDRLSNKPDRIGIDLLSIKIKEYGIIFGKHEQLSHDIDFLRELELVELVGTESMPSYRLGIPLMSQWLRKHIDWEDLRKKAIYEGREKIL